MMGRVREPTLDVDLIDNFVIESSTRTFKPNRTSLNLGHAPGGFSMSGPNPGAIGSNSRPMKSTSPTQAKVKVKFHEGQTVTCEFGR